MFTDWRQAGPGWVSTSESPGCTHGGMQDLWEKLREDRAEQAKGRMLDGEDGDGLGVSAEPEDCSLRQPCCVRMTEDGPRVRTMALEPGRQCSNLTLPLGQLCDLEQVT